MKRKQIRTTLKVPSTPEGREFLRLLRTYAVDGTRVWCRGRGPRKKAALADGRYARGYDQNLPLEHAKYFAVYISKVGLSTMPREEASRLRTAFWKKDDETFRTYNELTARLIAVTRERDLLMVENAELLTRGGRRAITLPEDPKLRPV